jgi:LEA14-like dessication related protein
VAHLSKSATDELTYHVTAPTYLAKQTVFFMKWRPASFPVWPLCLVLVASACSKPIQPQYLGIDNLQIYKIGLNESMVAGNVKFYNPNRFRLTLRHADVVLSLNDRQVAHVIIDSAIRIPALDSFYVPVSVQVSLGKIFSNAFQFLLKGQAKVNADGFVKLKKSAIDFRVPVHYEAYEQIDSVLKMIR